MRLAVTGTPGTGKTAATDRLADLACDGEQTVDVVHLNDVVREEGLWTERDADRDSLVADLDAVADWLDDYAAESDADALVVDSHLAHHLAADAVAVLRCRPAELERRLRERGETEAKASENAESEALDVVLSEAVAEHGEGNVYEIDTTDRTPEEVAEGLLAVLRGEREPSAGTVDFTGYL